MVSHWKYLVRCNLCSRPRYFKGRRGLKIHIGKTHKDENIPSNPTAPILDPTGVISSNDVAMPTKGDPRRALKRRRYHFKDGEPARKKPAPSIQLDAGFKWNLQALSNAAEAVETGGKSPVSALNELGVSVKYTLLCQRGPAHCPSFTVAVAVADMSFEGWGNSKREARASAARSCLNALLARAGRVLPLKGPTPDFTSDELSRYTVAEFQCTDTKIQPLDSNKLSPPVLFGQTVSPVSKSPINTLYEIYPGLTFTCTYGDGTPLDAVQVTPPQLNHSLRFKVIIKIKDQKFEGYGSSKKLAKLAACRAALGSINSLPQLTQRPTLESLPQNLANHIAKLVNEKFNNLMKDDVVHSKRKVLAGIVMTIDNKIEGAKVISVTTGTKCVSGEHMSVKGQAINDGHAEVTARRCLQRYLYAQLVMYAHAKDPTIAIPESDLEPAVGGGYQLKPLRALHLYVSTAPCGDGRIFSPHDYPFSEPDKHPNRLARGQLRTKIESGEGTIPVKNCTNVIQTWDGVLQGERLLTMSCSDKVARWCCVGLQGALLGRFLRPVYLHSLVLGSLLNHHHMYRAICGRIESYISSLPAPYSLQRPLLARAASTEVRDPTRAPPFSVCWTATSSFPEILNAITGKLETGHPSLLCKQSMFARWQYIARRLPELPQDSPQEPLPQDLEHMLYKDAKMLCTPYQTAKERLTTAFETAHLGKWIKKPIEQDQFVCELLDAAPAILFA